MVLLLPSLCSSVYILLASAGMAYAARAFASLLDASSVAIYFQKQIRYFALKSKV